jgi:hypothetical protein
MIWLNLCQTKAILKTAYRLRLYNNTFLKFDGSVLAYLVPSEEEEEEEEELQ